MKKSLTIAAVGLLLLLALFIYIEGKGVSRSTSASGEVSTTPVRAQLVEIGGQRVLAEIVDTDELRSKGLGGRDDLKAGTGMLFVFPEDGLWSFWMKDMRFSIDIFWLSSDKSIVHMEKRVSPSTYPTSFSPKKPARFVLELPAGFAERFDVEVGDTVSF